LNVPIAIPKLKGLFLNAPLPSEVPIPRWVQVAGVEVSREAYKIGWSSSCLTTDIFKKDNMNKFKLIILAAVFVLSAFLIIGCGSDSKNEVNRHTSTNTSNKASQFSRTRDQENSLVHWYEFNEGYAEAKSTGKPMAVFYETKWCTWCKKLKSTTLSDPTVAQMLNDYFIPIRVDGEGNGHIKFRGMELTERDFTRSVNVRGYPTTIFFDAKGNEITRRPGYLPPQYFILFLDYINDGSYKNQSFEAYAQKRLNNRG